MNHVCQKEKELGGLKDQVDRVEKELYVGRERRDPVLIRVDRVERIVGWMVYVSTALLIAVLVAVSGMVWSAVKQQQVSASVAAAHAGT
jgi:hypothetical protein